MAWEAQKRQEFYAQISDSERVEFINGEIVKPLPSTFRELSAEGNLLTLLGVYISLDNIGGMIGSGKLMISLSRNDYSADICYFGPEKAADFTPNQMHFPAPDLVVEILSPSTEKNDRGIKFVDYAAHGVAEYWIVDPTAETVEQYQLAGEEYALVVKVKDGPLESQVIPGFVIPVRAIFDDGENRAALQNLIG